MGLSKKDRRYILKNYPASSIKELARDFKVKPKDIRGVLEAAGRKIKEEKSETTVDILRYGKVSFLGAMMVVAVVSVIFLNSTRNGFHYDDIHSLLKNFDVLLDPKKHPDSLKLY